jgi:hypothetical protein
MSFRKATILICDNEHGCGEITFPRLEEITIDSFSSPATGLDGDSARELRAKAKKAGWKHTRDGRDWCDICVEGGAA